MVAFGEKKTHTSSMQMSLNCFGQLRIKDLGNALNNFYVQGKIDFLFGNKGEKWGFN